MPIPLMLTGMVLSVNMLTGMFIVALNQGMALNDQVTSVSQPMTQTMYYVIGKNNLQFDL